MQQGESKIQCTLIISKLRTLNQHSIFLLPFDMNGCKSGIDRINEWLLRLMLNVFESSFYDMLSILNQNRFINAG